MSESVSASKNWFRWFAVVLGITLLAHLVIRTGPRLLWNGLQSVGFGIVVIIAIGGLAHIIKTWAWRCTFTCDISRLTWRRSIAMRLVSEAIGQLGVAGKIIGEGVRVSLLGVAVPIENALSAAALDNALYISTSMIVAASAILVSVLVAPLPARMRIYAFGFAAGCVVVLIVGAVGVKRNWRLMGSSFAALGRLPGCGNWVNRKQSLVDATERNLLLFHRQAPGAFRMSVLLNFTSHLLAMAEVYIVLRYLTPKVSFLGALVLEGFTKLINLIGALNPGNVGTYEGGNMVVGKLFGLTAVTGLTLALCRRMRALFWSAVGAVCLIVMRRPEGKANVKVDRSLRTELPEGTQMQNKPSDTASTTSVIVLCDWEQGASGSSPSLERVATLPLLLRNVLTIRNKQKHPVTVCVPIASAQRIRSALWATGRMSDCVDWNPVHDFSLAPVIAKAAEISSKIVLVSGNGSYQPALLHSAMEWQGPGSVAFESNGALVGIYVISKPAAMFLADSRPAIQTISDLHSWMQSHDLVEMKEIPGNSWHRVASSADLPEAERKLDSWLTKPTDGIFARANRRVSIPISRILINFPMSPNMVTFFVLGVSLAAGAFYARGGYWNFLLASLLGLFASILDGCDGEVARLKLQSTRLGCWLDTICDYLYYIVTFVGMTVGLAQSSGSREYYSWGGALLVGVFATMTVLSWTRQRLSGAHPEKLLAIWQEKAEKRSSNPLLYLGRNTEFIIRRCFLPYALLAFAVCNATKFAFILAAFGANVAWIVSLYSHLDFSRSSVSQATSDRPAAVRSDAIA